MPIIIQNIKSSFSVSAKLDGVSKPLRSSRTMEEYLQMEDEWEPIKPTKPGQKRVDYDKFCSYC